MNLQQHEHNAYVMGIRHGFVTGLFVAIVMASFAILIYTATGAA